MYWWYFELSSITLIIIIIVVFNISKQNVYEIVLVTMPERHCLVFGRYANKSDPNFLKNSIYICNLFSSRNFNLAEKIERENGFIDDNYINMYEDDNNVLNVIVTV